MEKLFDVTQDEVLKVRTDLLIGRRMKQCCVVFN